MKTEKKGLFWWTKIHKLKLKNVKEWNSFCKNGKIPIKIPSNPQRIYKNTGWISWGDWLGTGTIASYKQIYLDIKDAKKIIHPLRIKNYKEWMQYCKSGKKPNNIPSAPNQIYKNKKFSKKCEKLHLPPKEIFHIHKW